jgi:hypothetical protein
MHIEIKMSLDKNFDRCIIFTKEADKVECDVAAPFVHANSVMFHS